MLHSSNIAQFPNLTKKHTDWRKLFSLNNFGFDKEKNDEKIEQFGVHDFLSISFQEFQIFSV